MKEKLKRLACDPRALLWLWVLIAVSGMTRLGHGRENNFLIFKYVYWHVVGQQPLYEHYPAEYFDMNHYGPFFSLVIAPFALPPVWLGMLLWLVALTLALYVAVRHNFFTRWQQVVIFWFCSHELLNAIQMQQFNIAIAAIIVGSYYLIRKERDFWAAFLIMLGTFVKLYGIVGLAFFLCSRHKLRFLLSLLGWGVILFALPMLISSPEYIVGQYREWYECLTGKNSDNMFALHQNISLLGMVRKISQCATYSDLWLIVPGLLLFGLPYLRLSQYNYKAFRQTLLASVLMFVVLFSTGSESCGYIIPFVGVVIWYTAAPWQRNGWDIALLVFVFVLSSLSPSDLFPAWLRKEWVQPYALKALPVTLVWLKLCWEMYTKDYAARE